MRIRLFFFALTSLVSTAVRGQLRNLDSHVQVFDREIQFDGNNVGGGNGGNGGNGGRGGPGGSGGDGGDGGQGGDSLLHITKATCKTYKGTYGVEFTSGADLSQVQLGDRSTGVGGIDVKGNLKRILKERGVLFNCVQVTPELQSCINTLLLKGREGNSVSTVGTGNVATLTAEAAIVGGTGDFVGSSGELVFRFIKEGRGELTMTVCQ